MGDTHTKKPAAPEGYFLIPRLLAYTLTGLALYIAVALTVLAIGVWVGIGTDDNQGKQLRHLAIQNRTALCGLRTDLQHRVDRAKSYLEVHPEGAPQFGVSAASIRVDMTNQRRTIKALSVLRCPPPRAADSP